MPPKSAPVAPPRRAFFFFTRPRPHGTLVASVQQAERAFGLRCNGLALRASGGQGAVPAAILINSDRAVLVLPGAPSSAAPLVFCTRAQHDQHSRGMTAPVRRIALRVARRKRGTRRDRTRLPAIGKLHRAIPISPASTINRPEPYTSEDRRERRASVLAGDASCE